MTLWNSFRIDFPEGKISEPQLMDVVKRVFPKYLKIILCSYFLFLFRCDADVVINNIFKAFDSEQTGKVVAQELLMCFSMSMKGTGADTPNMRHTYELSYIFQWRTSYIGHSDFMTKTEAGRLTLMRWSSFSQSFARSARALRLYNHLSDCMS